MDQRWGGRFVVKVLPLREVCKFFEIDPFTRSKFSQESNIKNHGNYCHYVRLQNKDGLILSRLPAESPF